MRSLLDSPCLYALSRRLLGGDKNDRTMVRDYVKPFPNARIMDIGCGPGNLLEFLPPDVEYRGCDTNPRYIDSAVSRFGSRGHFTVGGALDTLKASSMRFDVILAIGFLHHIDDHEAAATLRETALHLVPQGRFLAIDNVYVQGQNPLARLIISLDRGCHVRTPEQYLMLAKPHFSRIESLVINNMLRVIPYTHFLMNCSP